MCTSLSTMILLCCAPHQPNATLDQNTLRFSSNTKHLEGRARCSAFLRGPSPHSITSPNLNSYEFTFSLPSKARQNQTYLSSLLYQQWQPHSRFLDQPSSGPPRARPESPIPTPGSPFLPIGGHRCSVGQRRQITSAQNRVGNRIRRGNWAGPDPCSLQGASQRKRRNSCGRKPWKRRRFTTSCTTPPSPPDSPLMFGKGTKNRNFPSFHLSIRRL
ncbi:unnamed protein product [Sphenostylis stenocarpa]|uniref:Uncharacterized protein n=1 Tax=Sphenostylis stenocarpa TaxID=92480 RepID=A0AA86SN14_9FABA|nr:unnamed protein product [Sphenostylis stenocarpa]